jgi:hypothetical protein
MRVLAAVRIASSRSASVGIVSSRGDSTMMRERAPPMRYFVCVPAGATTSNENPPSVR